MVDAMMCLNIDYHFQDEIDAFLQKQYAIWSVTLHFSFRLLRQQGYYVSAAGWHIYIFIFLELLKLKS